MNRRSFLNLAALAIAGKAAERVFPFRVYSIPKKIVVADPLALFGGMSPLPLSETATGALIRYQNAVARDMSLYGSAPITPELVRIMQKQFIEALGTEPPRFNFYSSL